MQRTQQQTFSSFVFFAVVALPFLLGCGGKSENSIMECSASTLPADQLESIQNNTFFQGKGPNAYLILPNPIDATQINDISARDSRLAKVFARVSLPDLLNPARLSNQFFKVSITDINDPVSSLARPNEKGEYLFAPLNIHYSEVMAYYSISSLLQYVETLGFSVVKSRPLYVMVKAHSEDPNEVNGGYDHHYLNPELPRMVRFYGNTEFHPAMDRDMFWHEIGHLIVESASREKGIDFAGDNGSVFTEGSALHECLADTITESLANQPHIGKWIARNYEGFKPGEPLRSAVDTGKPLTFESVIVSGMSVGIPERYQVAEWCTRVLWDIRSRFISEDSAFGDHYYNRFIFSAVSLLGRDTSFSKFRKALVGADGTLHCGQHSETIQKAFASRGFPEDASNLPARGLRFSVKATGLDMDGDEIRMTNPAPGSTLSFEFSIQNTSGVTARNVRVVLETDSSNLLYPTVYMQGFGDLPSGQFLQIGGTKGLDFGYSLFGQIDGSARPGSSLKYRLNLLIDNGPGESFVGEIRL